MRVLVHVVGRMKAGPEKELVQRYLDRFKKAGPALGLEFVGVTEMVESRASDADARRAEETAKLFSHLEEGAALLLLDERGKTPTSEAFAEQIARMRDGGRKKLVLAIGGPDGHDEAARQRAEMVVSFGAATWPHQLVRVMLAEQLYRVATILAGHPYHRN